MIVTPGDVSWRGAEAERDKETVREGSSRGGGAHGRWNEAEQGNEKVREGSRARMGGGTRQSRAKRQLEKAAAAAEEARHCGRTTPGRTGPRRSPRTTSRGGRPQRSAPPAR